MNKILIIDPGKGWGQFVSKMYCFQKLAEYQNSKVVFLTKRSTQAEYYLRDTTFCDEVIYFDEQREKYDTDHSNWLKVSLTLSTLLILLYFIFPSKLLEIGAGTTEVRKMVISKGLLH